MSSPTLYRPGGPAWRLVARSEMLSKGSLPGWPGPSSWTLPVVVGLLFLGLQYLVLIYLIEVFVPLAFREAPHLWSLPELWGHTADYGPGLLSELARVNTLFVLYLWLSYRGQGRRWEARSSVQLMVGLALLFLASQYALYRILHLSAVEYSVEMIRLAP